VAALGNYVREWSKHFGVRAEFHTVGVESGRLEPKVEIHLYRVMQEALNNVHKHAGATQVEVMLERRDGDVALVVEDNGRGFDPESVVPSEGKERLGLGGMRERAALIGGTLQIESTRGGGTTVFVRVPLAPSAEESAHDGEDSRTSR
jgi:signal transduction histidine kinase